MRAPASLIMADELQGIGAQELPRGSEVIIYGLTSNQDGGAIAATSATLMYLPRMCRQWRPVSAPETSLAPPCTERRSYTASNSLHHKLCSIVELLRAPSVLGRPAPHDQLALLVYRCPPCARIEYCSGQRTSSMPLVRHIVRLARRRGAPGQFAGPPLAPLSPKVIDRHVAARALPFPALCAREWAWGAGAGHGLTCMEFRRGFQSSCSPPLEYGQAPLAGGDILCTNPWLLDDPPAAPQLAMPQTLRHIVGMAAMPFVAALRLGVASALPRATSTGSSQRHVCWEVRSVGGTMESIAHAATQMVVERRWFRVYKSSSCSRTGSHSHRLTDLLAQTILTRALQTGRP